uniref:hypothetical protein n=1 Tax=Cupriavidus necator TaxID=106590 RepID=UPI003F49A332
MLQALTTTSGESWFAPIQRNVIENPKAIKWKRRSITAIPPGAFSLSQLTSCGSAYAERPDMRSQPKQRGAGRLQTNQLC